MGRTSGYKYLKLVHGSLCHEWLAKRVVTRWSYFVYHANNVCSGGSETEMCRRSWIQIIVSRNYVLATNRNSVHFCTIVEHPMTVSMSLRWAQRWASMEHQRFIVLPIQQSPGCIVSCIHPRRIGCRHRLNGKPRTPSPTIEMCINWASTISGLTSWILTGLCNGI